MTCAEQDFHIQESPATMLYVIILYNGNDGIEFW